jgi:ABC-type Fe3+ transport system substrate-binding protein
VHGNRQGGRPSLKHVKNRARQRTGAKTARAVGWNVMMTTEARRHGSGWTGFAIVTAVMLGFLGSARAEAPSPALAELIKAAAAEGKIDLQWSSSLLGGLDGVGQAVAGMNKMFGIHLEGRLTPDPDSVPQLLNKVAVTQSANQPSPTDAFVGTTVHIATAVQKGMVQGADWTALLPGRIDASTIEDKGMAVRVFTTLPGGIVYNTQLAPHPPTSLAELLKPEWKGKIASNPYGASFELLSASDVWGEDKALDFARKFSAQIGGLIGCPDMERVASGEFELFALDCSGRNWVQFQRQGAPLGFMIPSDFAAQRYYYMVIPKNAAHPNAGKLFVTYLMTSEGQSILWKTGDYDLHTFPDSGMRKVIAEYEARGAKFREYTLDWWAKHPEVVPAQRKAVDIITKQQ